jgi:multiple sugar transport system permease protein
MIPLYTIMRRLGLLYTPYGLILAYTTFTIPFSVWMIQGFIRDMPFSLEEAALVERMQQGDRVHTASLYDTYPCLLAAEMYIFKQSWNEYTLSSDVHEPRHPNHPRGAGEPIVARLGVEWDMLCAGGTISVLAVCVMFLLSPRSGWSPG